ncbi:MAG: alpha/beta fold hydrolase, partial [Deltaproteobacteria bacterium]|nr:alpha/beta fold hydrolase [Deltaproteobacteria bacterium]
VKAFKGKTQKTAVYRLVRAIPRRERRHHALRGGLARFLGRHNELALLRERFDTDRGGAGQVVFVSGEAGIGKSRLLHELRRQLDPESFTWVEGQCVSYGTGASFLPVIDLLRGIFEIDEADAGKVIIDKVHARCAGLGDAALAGEPFLCDLLGVDPGDERLEHLQELHRSGLVFESVRDLIHALAQKQPVVLMIEDLHWIDQSSEQLLRRLFDTLATVPVLALVTHRSEYSWPHHEHDYFSRIRLPGLPPALVEELTRSVLGREDIPADLNRVVGERSDGNPFFVEEVAKSLEEQGVLDANPSEARLWDVVPATVQEVLLARIDRLDGSARRTLQIAAVIGREFTVRVLERLAGEPEGASSALEDLSGLELIYEKASYPDLAYMFKHALTHDVAYQTLLERERRDLHKTVAQLIEELYAERLPEFYETLAYQYEGADVPERAAHYALLAGERAAKSLSPEAAAHFERAAGHARDRAGCEEIFIRAQVGLGDHLLRLGKTDAANALYREAIDAVGDDETRERLRLKIPERRFFVRDGVRLAYYIHGKGAGGDPSGVVPVVFLHPMIQGSLSFEDMAQRMCQEHCVIHADPRGTGASDKLDEKYDFGVRAEDAIAILRQLPYERFILVGDSDGVRIALRAYHAMPERVEKLILFGYTLVGLWSPENPLGRTEEETAALVALLEGDFDELMNAFWAFVANEPGMSAWREMVIEDWRQEVGDALFRDFLHDAMLNDESHLLEGVDVPTLVIAAENDVATVERIHDMANKIEGAQRALIQDASHMAPWTAIDTFCAILKEFITTGKLSREVWPR